MFYIALSLFLFLSEREWRTTRAFKRFWRDLLQKKHIAYSDRNAFVVDCHALELHRLRAETILFTREEISEFLKSSRTFLARVVSKKNGNQGVCAREARTRSKGIRGKRDDKPDEKEAFCSRWEKDVSRDTV